MLVRIPKVLSGETLARCREIVVAGPWADGRLTAGSQSEQMKNNLQLPEESAAAREGGRIVLDALAKSALFFTAALPKRIFPPLFNCYTGSTNVFGDHIDNAVRTHAASGERVRTDIAATLFLTSPEDYDGGELIIEESFSTQSVKLAAGDLVVYPASSVHRVEPVTRGARISAFFWLESMVRSAEQRRLLCEFDMAVLELRRAHGDTAAMVRLAGCYHNLLRMWAEV
ncbi:MAG: Fe2+-dependent dioxygenase [Pseudomonadota bacterium]